MIYLHQIANDDFFLFHADQVATEAVEVVRRLKPASVVMRRRDDGNVCYYLYAAQEFLDRLAQPAGEQPLLEALQLQDQIATPGLDAYEDAEAAPPRCVVVGGDRVIGVYNVAQPPVVGKRQGGAESAVTESIPVSRSLLADFPDQVALGQTVSLLVRLTQRMREQHGLSIAVPIGAQLDIVVRPQRGFVLEGSSEALLTVTDEEETLPIQFKLRATEVGPGRIQVFCFREGQPLGAITLASIVVAADREITQQRTTEERALAQLRPAQPDLTLVIFENMNQGRLSSITFRLSATNREHGLNLKLFGPVRLHMDPLQYFEYFFKDIEGLPIRTDKEQAIAAEKLALKGAMLFQDLLPDDLRELLWSLREKIHTVQVLSDEPWIPWELLKLQGRENGRVVEGLFMCEAFTMTRWFPGIGMWPELRLKQMALVVPTDSGLPYALDEQDYLLSLANNQRQITKIPASFLDVVDTLSRGEHDGWHFVGHGKFSAPDANRSSVLLEGGQRLCAEEICGRVSNCGLTRPLVFLNACQTGREALSLTGVGGWAKRFAEAGAAGFIGPLWSVYDDAGYQFAQAFYDHLLVGETIGQAAREARAAIKPHNDRLAYTVFADPLAAIELHEDNGSREAQL